MKLRRALAILALLAVAILPVAAAPAVVSGDVYSQITTDGTLWNMYGDWNVYVTAQTDDWNKIYINFGRALQTNAGYSSAANTIANTVAAVVYEEVNNQYAYGLVDISKFFAMDKVLLGQLMGGYYYTATAAYSSKLFAAYPRVAYRYTSAPDWWMQVQVGLPGVAGVKFGITPIDYAPATNSYSLQNDFIVIPYLNLNLGNGMTANVDASYFGNKKADLAKGVLTAEGDFTMLAAPLKIEAGAGIDIDLNGNTFQYCVTGRGTFYLDDKMTTFVQGAVGLRGTFGLVSTVTTYAVDRVEINAQATFLPLVDILECATLDLTSTTAPFRSADTAVRINIGATDLYVGYVYTTVNGGNVWSSAILPTPVNGAATTATGGAYVKMYVPFN